MKRFPRSFLLPLGLLGLTALLIVWFHAPPGHAERTSGTPEYSASISSTASRAIIPDSAPEPPPSLSSEERLFALLSRAGTEPSVLRPVEAWFSHGRKAPLAARGIAAIPPGLLLGYEKGNAVRLALPGGREASGIVHTVAAPEPGLTVLGGKILAPRPGFFHFEQSADGLRGRMAFKDAPTVSRIFPVAGGVHAFIEQPRELTICLGVKKDLSDLLSGVFNAGVIELASGLNPWALQSFPGAPGVIYLDFDGHTVSNTIWNSEFTDGDPIEALPFDEFVPTSASYKPEWIVEVFNRCKEDFAPFNINVTTSQSVFNAAAAGKRTRVIITPTEAWYPRDAGGVAYPDTFTGSSDTPCWVWNRGIQWSMPETVSHEAGHTLGLSHSNHGSPATTYDEYYGGHGIWAPIMGDSFNGQRAYTQWDNGSYNGALNNEDQIGILAATGAGTNNVGYRTDDHGGTSGTATLLTTNSGGVARGSGHIERNGDVDVFRFTMPAGTFDILAESHSPGPNAYLKVNLRNSAYTLLISFTTAGTQPANNTYTAAAGGQFYLEVTHTARTATTGDPGFPAYAALGSYRLAIAEPGGDDLRPVPVSLTIAPAVFGYEKLEIAAVITDNKGIRLDTLNNGDLQIKKGTTTWSPPIVSTASDVTEGTRKVIARFHFTPPGGFWDPGDAGTYTITFKSGAVADGNGNTNAASLSQTLDIPATDTHLTTITAPSQWPATVGGASTYTFNLTFHDKDTAFNLSSFGSNDVEVRDPEGALLPVQFIGKSATDYNRFIIASYSFTPPGGTWDDDDVGAYSVRVPSGRVLHSTGTSVPFTNLTGPSHRVVIFERDMDTNPGFTLGTGWAWGNPTGDGGLASGNGKDPEDAHTGSNVLGTNLSGNYATNTAIRYATSPAFSTTGYQSLNLNYWRWANYDDPATIEYRIGSGSWMPLFTDDFAFDDSWTEQNIPLPPECDHQPAVQLRWSLGPTGSPNTLRPMGGWNLDDIRITAGAPYAPGRLLVSWLGAGRFSVTEGGDARSYILKLDQNPGANPVTVTLSSGRGTTELNHPATVTLNSTNWSTGLVVSVSADDNTRVDGDRTSSIRHTLSSANPHFSGIVGTGLAVYIFDEETAIIGTQPQSVTIPQGTSTTLSVGLNAVSGTKTYQWYRGKSGSTSNPVSGATSATLSVTATANPADYWVRIVRTYNILYTTTENSDTATVSPLTGYAAWKHNLLSYGYTQTQLDAPAFDSGDPDADGLSHLMEYALGGQPYTQDAALLPRIVVLNDQLYFRFRRQRADLDYTVETSLTPDQWDPLVTNPGSVSPSTDQSILIPSGIQPATFVRLRVSR